jgi:amino acid adenylation domain-containing protein
MTSSTPRETARPTSLEGPHAGLEGASQGEPFAAARARLPLECSRSLEPDSPSRHELDVQAGDALATLAAALEVPSLTALAAAWVAYVARTRSSDATADVELCEPPSNGGGPAPRALCTVFDESQPFEALARAIASRAHPSGTEPKPAFTVARAREDDAALARVELDDRGLVRLSLDASRFFPSTAAELADGFAALLASAAATPGKPVAELSLLSDAQRAHLVFDVNATHAPFEPRCFHELFEEQAQATPHAVALRFHDSALSYAELDAKANQIAHYLTKHGGERRPVAILFERSAEMIIALLGVMKAGGAYVPLLPDVPPARLAHQLAETGAPIVLTQAKLESAIPAASAVRVVCLDRDAATLEREPKTSLGRLARPEDLAYVIYTSGSTGNPKGVAVRHDNLVNYTRFLAKKLGLELAGHAAQALSCATVSTLAADLGNTSIFPCLATGGCLHVIDHAMSLDGNAFAAYARKYPIDVLKITPSHLAALLAYEGCDEVLPRRFLVTGGEGSTWPLREKVRARPGLVWFNHYGPTETTIGSLTYDLDEVDRHFTPIIPIGRPIANTRVYVLDDRRRLVPKGVVGELYIGGRGVTAGYMNQPEMTAERFLDDPFAASPGARMYRTGDRVRMLPSGAIEFLGRVDHQVKIRGYRIELGEIEATLRRHPDVRQTIVVAREDRPGDLRIVAYVVPARAPAPPTSRLADALGAELPPFMLPSAFVMLDALPLNANGKVDRKALPKPEESITGGEDDDDAPAPSLGTLEQKVVDIWRDVLGAKRVSPTDDFFRIGGDSLKALYVLARIEKELGKRLTHGELIMAPTVKGLVAALQREGPRREFASLVPLQPHGTKPPLFCFHGGGGHVYYYRDLARRLGSDQPFYGLQGRHADGKLPRQTRVEDMAEFYLEEMKEVAPTGPYYLAGASFGGKVAFEIAQQLLRRGEKAALVAMFDTWGPGYPDYQVGHTAQAAGWLYRRIEHHLGSVLMLEHERRWPYLKEKAQKTREELRDVVNLKLSQLKQRKVPGVAKIAPDVDEGFIAIASKAYKPTFYPGKVILFRSKQQPIGVRYDRSLGWQGLAADLEIHDVVGLHAAVVAEPRVKFLVEKLLPCLEEARAAHGA